MDQLAPWFRVLAPDMFGAGRGPPWPHDTDVTLSDEVARLEPVFSSAGEPFSLVGHSYGGAVALIAALQNQERFRDIVVFEPVLFSVLEEADPGQEPFGGIASVVADADSLAKAGDTDAAAERFIDYWMGTGAWAAIPEGRRGPISDSISDVNGWLVALSKEPTPLEAFRALDVPVLYLIGTRSPSSSRGVADLITSVLPNVDVRELDGLGHMGPVTHPQIVNDAITQFLQDSNTR
jgi:pimeloyl-ACP methyl ester carboxylesterase